MKRYFKLFVAIGGLTIMTSCNSPEITQNGSNSDSNLMLYFGQKPPGKKAEVFAPDVLTFEPHDSPIILQNETSLIIGTMGDGMKFYELINGNLSLSTNPFNFNILEICNGEDVYCNGIELSQSENRIYFLLWKNGNEKFHFIEKEGNNWTSPKLLSDELDSFKTHWQFTVAKNENLYFSSEGLKVSVYDGNSHLKPVSLKMEDGSFIEGETPFIAPDESYLIFSRNDDLHISYKRNNDNWTNPQHLGQDINSDKLDLCPRISPNGKYLFFITRRDSPYFAIYWADASFIEELRPDE